MRQLIRLLDTMKNRGYVIRSPDGKIEIAKPCPAEVEYFTKVEPFVFLDGKPFDANKVVNQVISGWTSGPDRNEEIDGPFPVFSIECLNGELDFFTKQYTTERENGKTMCILVIEISPKEYGYYSLTDSYSLDGRLLGTVAWKSNIDGDTVKYYLQRLQREKTGIETTRTMVKIGEGKHSRQHRIRRVVHVRPNNKSTASDGSRSIDWTHRFEVRGHWVSLPGKLGKDREGVYCVNDWTWRINYVKGPDHLPLIKKTRVVDSGDAE